MILGITASRRDFTKHVESVVIDLLCRIKPATVIHGACVGGDIQIVELVHEFYLNWSEKRPWIVAYPGYSVGTQDRSCQSERAIQLSDEVMPEQGHFSRNREIVNRSSIVMGVTSYWKEQEPEYGSGGGTWMTLQYAHRIGLSYYVVWANGEVTPRNFS